MSDPTKTPPKPPKPFDFNEYETMFYLKEMDKLSTILGFDPAIPMKPEQMSSAFAVAKLNADYEGQMKAKIKAKEAALHKSMEEAMLKPMALGLDMLGKVSNKKTLKFVCEAHHHQSNSLPCPWLNCGTAGGVGILKMYSPEIFEPYSPIEPKNDKVPLKIITFVRWAWVTVCCGMEGYEWVPAGMTAVLDTFKTPTGTCCHIVRVPQHPDFP